MSFSARYKNLFIASVVLIDCEFDFCITVFTCVSSYY